VAQVVPQPPGQSPAQKYTSSAAQGGGVQTGCGVSPNSGVGVRVGWVDKVNVGGNVATCVAGADGSNEQAERIRMDTAAKPYL